VGVVVVRVVVLYGPSEAVRHWGLQEFI
jgi:hypothetical protein